MLQARLFDFGWLKLRRPQFAEGAVRAYILVAERYLDNVKDDDQNLVLPATTCAERAVRLAYQITGDEELKAQAKELICSITSRLLKIGETTFIPRVEDIILKLGLGDPDERATLCREAARKAVAAAANPHSIRDLWLKAADWAEKGKDTNEANAARTAAAETMVELAELTAVGEKPSFLAAASHLAEAIKIYRRVPGEQLRKDTLRQKLSDYQGRMHDEMGEISTPIDLTEAVQWAISNVEGRSLHEAISRFVILTGPARLSKLRENVNQQAADTPLRFLMPATISDPDGRTIDLIPPLFGGTPEEQEKAMRYHMMWLVNMDNSAFGAGIIDAARKKIWEEHPITMFEMSQIANLSPFVPEGNEQLFAKGFLAGFEGDYGVALHILVPQMENALRQQLKRRGFSTSTNERSDAVAQEAITLDRILAHDAVCEIYGEDMQFNLQATFTERTASPLRHIVAHGLVDDSAAWSVSSAYAFWLILRLTVLPLVEEARKKAHQNKAGDAPPQAGESKSDDAKLK